MRRFKPTVLAVACLLALPLLLLPYLAAWHKARAALVEEATHYEPVSLVKDSYLLQTERRNIGGGAYVTFTIRLQPSGELLYTCPQLYRSWDLRAIGWSQEGYDVIVRTGERGVAVYRYSDGGWRL